MTLLGGVLWLHDVHDVEAFCRRIIQRHLRLTKATLRQHDYEDLASYLIETSWELSLKYDPALSSSFSKYAYTLLQLRVTEWYRKRFYRDQTNTDWYRKRFPNAQPASREDRENFHFPESLDRDDGALGQAVADRPADPEGDGTGDLGWLWDYLDRPAEHDPAAGGGAGVRDQPDGGVGALGDQHPPPGIGRLNIKQFRRAA